MFLGQKLRNVLSILAFIYCVNSYSFESKKTLEDSPLGATHSLFKGKSSLWLGGENGIFAITGSYVLRYGEKDHSLFEYDVESIYEDIQGGIWIATFGKGIYFLEADEFYKVDFNIKEKVSLFCRDIKGIDEVIYFSCGGEIYSYSIATGKYKLELDSSIADTRDITFFEIAENTIYAIDEYNKLISSNNGEILELISPDKFENILEFHTVFVLDSNTLLVGTNKGLLSIDRKNNQVGFLLTDSIDEDVTQIFKFGNQDLWIYQNGFKRIEFMNNKQPETVKIFDEMGGVDFGDVYDVSVFDDDTFVFSSPLFGITTFNSINNSIAYLNLSKSSSGSIEESFFDGEKLMLSFNNRLQEFDLDTFVIKELTEDIGFVSSIRKLSGNAYLIFSDKLGLAEVGFKQGGDYEIKYFNIDLKGGEITSILSYSESYSLFGVIGGKSPGIYRIDKYGNYKQLVKSVNPDILLKKTDGQIIVALRFYGVKSLSELEQIDVENLIVDKKLAYINNCLLEDNQGVIWLCTDGAGLAYLDENSGDLKYIDTVYTANSRHIRELVQDSEGYFWVMTNQGLVRYDHVNKTSIKLGKEDGIKDVDFEITASINLTDDQILIAGDRENYIVNTRLANRFLDKRLKKVNQTVFVDLMVLLRDEQGMVSKKLDLIKSVENNTPMVISYDEFLFELSFAANNFVDRDVLKFQYRLVGLNNSWVDASTKNASATYSTLPSGDYLFEVRVVDPKSASIQPVNSLKIKVRPPYWQTWQAYTVYIIACILALIGFSKYRTFQLKSLNERLESSVLIQTKELATSKRRLGDALHHKELLYANASHEFRTPLALISGPIEQLAKSITDEKSKRFLDILRLNAFRLTNLVDQVLELSKIDSSRLDDKVHYDLYNSIQIIVESFRPISLSKGQQLIFKNTCEGTGTYIADSLEKILSNLLMNAFKYNNEGGDVVVCVSSVDSTLTIEIADHGLGIEAENMDLIFDRFTRLENASEANGSGLGLAVVKELVNANGGNIEVESQIGEGTKFIISLPKSNVTSITESELFVSTSIDNNKTELEVVDIDSTISSVNNEATKKPSILIVEDQVDMRNYLSLIFSKEYDCYSAKNGQEGFEKSLEIIPDIIVTDLMMPVSDGFELAGKIRENELTSHIPIIMLTAKGDDKTRMASWGHHIDHYIKKPFNNLELLARAKNLLEIRRKISQKYNFNGVENKNIFELNSDCMSSERDTRFYDKFIDWLEDNYKDNRCSRSRAVIELAISERQLNRKLTAFTNSSFTELLRKYRLIKAKDDLLNGKQITETAFNVGFSSSAYFSNKFKKEFGLSPKAYIKKMKAD
ncbi:ATP-binding protein [Aliiglaciecola sp. NS0011-25]|uniref:hybrid sensor histidine kinase/response regulator transcription factor n=1 Tax=Aliiglaciecola sp. NS0011-25 TaxID=3127654 RepID=UPI00333F4408